MQQVIYTQCFQESLLTALQQGGQPDRMILLTDDNTHRHCLPLLADCLSDCYLIEIQSGDTHKTLDTLRHVWEELQYAHATRHSLLLNLGGGMLTDLGGFAAATFKRGIRFINIPTTLLAMVDAAVGGKTGINFGGLKNEIGSFANAETVIIHTEFLRTLDSSNLYSGYAEMLKHALLSDLEMWAEHLDFDWQQPNLLTLQRLVADSINLKQRIVEQDPHERGLRKALNLGHTVGHAFESFLLDRNTPVLHGYAVAWGIVCELFMSSVLLGFPSSVLQPTVKFIFEHYGRPLFTCDDYEHLYELMLHDKKNVGTRINFTLLADLGEIRIDQQIDKQLVFDAFDYLREA